MKLVSTLAYFVRNTQQPLFKQAKQPQSAVLFTPNLQSAEKRPKESVVRQVAKKQMDPVGTNIGKVQLKQKKSAVGESRKRFFTKRSQQQGLSPTAPHPSIIQNSPKAAPQQTKVAELLKDSQLPMDLFAIHKQYCHQFTPANYEHLFIKLSFSTQQPQTVLHYARKKKGLSNQHSNGAESELRVMTKEEMIAHPEWRDIVRAIIEKLEGAKDIGTLNAYIPTFILIQKCFSFTPAAIYEYVLARNALAGFNELSKEQVSNLIHFLKYNNRLKQISGLQNVVSSLEENQSIKIDTFLQNLASEIINNPKKYSKADFLNVFIVVNRRKKRMSILTQQLMTKSQGLMLQYCADYSFQNIYTYMKIYAFFHKNPNQQLLDTLITHLLDKIPSQNNHYVLMMALHNIKHGKLVFKNPKEKGTTEQSIQLEARRLAIRLAKVLSQKMEFNSTQIIQFLSNCFHNQITDGQVLSVIQTKIIKQSHQFNLQRLGAALFKLHLLGGRPKRLLKRVLDEFTLRYKEQMDHLKQEDTFSAPTEDNQHAVPSPNFRQIHLQQCLIMLIWTATQYQDCKIVADSLKDIYPSLLNSMDPLAIELVDNINHKFSLHKLSQIISYKFTPGIFPEGRLSEFYRHQSTKSQVQKLMWEQAGLTGKFVANYNTVAHKFLPQRWSAASTYQIEEYVDFCLSSSSQSFFDEHTVLPADFLVRRQKVIKGGKGGK